VRGYKSLKSVDRERRKKAGQRVRPSLRDETDRGKAGRAVTRNQNLRGNLESPKAARGSVRG